jgi:N-acetylmuramic acid 6-phosphate (MurNAc-6-P) etherase
MINVQLKNRKLRERARVILARAAGVSAATAAQTLRESGEQLPVALLMLWKKVSQEQALHLLGAGPNTASVLRAAWAERRRATSRGQVRAEGRRRAGRQRNL